MTPPILPLSGEANRADAGAGEDLGVVAAEVEVEAEAGEEDGNPRQLRDPSLSSSEDDDMAREKAASSIPILDFVSSKDDFDDWIERFEVAVNLACTPQTAARKRELYLQWLPLKLDATARAVLKQIPANTAYEVVQGVNGVKAQLKELLIDPNEAYKWQALKNKITWDGIESFQALATRVEQAVEKYEKELDAAARRRSYFFRFREALPKVYQDAIDIGLAKGERSLANAKELALRVQMTRPEQNVDFTGASMSDDRVHGLELKVAEIGTKLDNLVLDLKDKKDEKDPKRDSMERYKGNRSQGRQSYGRSSSGWSSDGRRDDRRDRDKRYDRDRRDNRDRDRNRGDSRDRDRNRRDSRDRDRNRGDSRNRDGNRGDSRDRDRNRRDDRNRDRNRGGDGRRDSGKDRDYRRGGDRNGRGGNRDGSSRGRDSSTSREREPSRERGKNRNRDKGDNKVEFRSLKTADESSNDHSESEAEPAVRKKVKKKRKEN